MRSVHPFVVGALVTILGALPSGTAHLSAQSAASLSSSQPPLARAHGAAVLANLRLQFEANRGQANERTRFLSRGRGYTLSLTDADVVLAPRSGRALRMELVGRNDAAVAVGVDELPGKANYFIGNNPRKWRTNVPTYAKVKYEDIYRGIDLVYYGNQRRLEYDFVAAQGADVGRIRLKLSGETTDTPSVRIEANGDLVVSVGDGEARFEKPVAYQLEQAGVHDPVDARFALRSDGTVGFEVGRYDRSRPLVVDPVLEYSTLLGGDSFDDMRGIAVDAARNIYVAVGTTSDDLPLVNALDGPLEDTYVAKIGANGALIYSTYFGGGVCDHISGIPIDCDLLAGMGIDDDGNVYVTGTTSSTNFPLVNPRQSSLKGVDDAFVAKISADGSTLLYSTYLGGSGADSGIGIAVDTVTGHALIVGETESNDFPTKNAFQDSLNPGGRDVFVVNLLADGQTLNYSSYFGGTGDELAAGIATDNNGGAYITGTTSSRDLPLKRAFQSALAGNTSLDVFVTKLHTFRVGADSLEFSTYLGGSTSDTPHGIAADSAGRVWVVGETTSPDFPLKRPLQATYGGGNTDGFLTKIDTEPAATETLVFSSYFGGSRNDTAQGVTITGSLVAWIVGGTSSVDFRVTANALQPTLSAPSRDAFVARIAADGDGPTLLYSSYFGGASDSDLAEFVASPSQTSFEGYVAGITFAPDFPTTPDAFQRTIGLASDGFITRFVFTPDIAFDPIPPVTISAGGSGTTPLTVRSIDEFENRFALRIIDQPSNGLPTGALTATFANLGTNAEGSQFILTPNGIAASVLTVSADLRVPPGAYTLLVTVEGGAPPRQAIIPITVVATTASTSASIAAMNTAGCIDNAGIANALTSKLAAAQAAADRGDVKSAINTYAALLNQISGQSGKHIGTSCTIGASTFNPTLVLTEDVRSLVANLSSSAAANPIVGYVTGAANVGVAGATVALLDSTNAVVASASTDATGFYYFSTTSSLVTGAGYSVRVIGLTGLASPSQSFTWASAGVALGSLSVQ